MDAALPFLFVAFFVLVVLVGIASYVAAKKRREALSAYALTRGWTWTERDDSLTHRFDCSPFGTGDDRRALNVLRGTYDGREMVAFDYQYETTSGTGKDRRTTTHHYSVLALDIGVTMPSLAVTPQNLLTGFFGRVTNTDIELELEDFNRAFVVKAADRKFASDVLHPQLMEILLTEPDVAWRFVDHTLLAAQSGQHSPAEVDAKLAHLDRILDSVPEFVWREVKGG